MLGKIRSYRPYYKSTLTLALPVVISQLGHMMVQVSDNIIVGHFAGTIALAAVSLVHAVFMVIMVVGFGIAYGITPLIAQENGRHRYIECARLLANAFWLNLVTAICLFGLICFGSVFAIEHLDQDPRVVKEAKPYLLILALSIVPLMIFSAFKQFAEGLGFTRQAMNITIWGNVLNIILAVVFVKGLFGISPMGIKGVGYATLIDRILMAIVMMWYVLRSSDFSKYLVGFSLFSVHGDRIREILRIGAPVALQYVFEIGAFAAAALLAGTIGAVQQASHQVAIQLASATYMIGSGIATAATIKVGNSYGRKNIFRAGRFAGAAYLLVLLFMVFTASIFTLFNSYLPYLFTTDSKVVLIASQLLIIAGIFQFFDGTQVVGLGILRGMGDVNVPTIITFIAYWVIGLPAGYFMGVVWGAGLQGIWYGLTFGLLSSSLMLYIRYRLVMRRNLL